MNEFWFKPKTYGYGATPVTWQGWLVTGAALIVLLASSMLITVFEHQSLLSVFALIAIDVLCLAALLIVSRRKTRGEWHWRWGRHNNENE
jgi:hypothetical protein